MGCFFDLHCESKNIPLYFTFTFYLSVCSAAIAVKSIYSNHKFDIVTVVNARLIGLGCCFVRLSICPLLDVCFVAKRKNVLPIFDIVRKRQSL